MVINSGTGRHVRGRDREPGAHVRLLLGAQVTDPYIHAPPGSVPAGEIQSTGAAGAFNYAVAPADAWNQLIEVDGFGTDDWVTPGSSTSGMSGSSSVGIPQVSVAQLSPSGGETPGW